MKRTCFALCLLAALALAAAAQSLSACQRPAEEDKPAGAPVAPTGKPLLWRDPGVVEKLDLAGGPLGRQAAPKAPFTFMEESFSGSNPKIKIRDANKVQWTMKFGTEVNAETFASRLTCSRSQSRVMVSCASSTSGPRARTAKSKRGSSSRPCVGST